MTAPRLARAGRSRFFVGIGLLIVMVGFVAIFNSSQKQLDESKLLNIKCEQQQESLNARMHAIIENKLRLERSLESERKEHLETRHSFEKKVKELKDNHNRASMEMNVRFDSLQQHYKLLQSEHNELVEESSKTKLSQSDQINGLEGKSKSLQSQLQLMTNQHEKDIGRWKVNYENIVREKDRLQTLLSNQNVEKYKTDTKLLQLIIDEYKSNCEYQPKTKFFDSNINMSSMPVTYKDNGYNHPLDKPSIQKSFEEQKLVSLDLYEIPIILTHNIKSTNNSTLTSALAETVNSRKLEKNGDGNVQQVNSILANSRKSLGSMINSVENFQIAPNPIISNDHQDNVQQAPPLNSIRSSSTASNDARPFGDEVNRRALSFASPSSTTSEKLKNSSTKANNSVKEADGQLKSKQIALGVPPIPENFEQLIHNDDNVSLNDKRSKQNILANLENTGNNRYANAVNDFSGKIKEGEMSNIAHDKDINFNLGVVDDKSNLKLHMPEVLDNAAEDDTNNFFESKMSHKKDHGELEDGDRDTLNNEVAGDQGKEAALVDGIHLEEMNEGDEDEDDYLNFAARHQAGQAIRI